MAMTNYGKAQMLGAFLGVKSAGPLYLGLSQTRPDESGEAIVEPHKTTGYARKLLCDDPDGTYSGKVRLLSVDENTTIATNNEDILMNEVKSSWGTLPYWFLTDSRENGKPLCWGEFSQPLAPGNNTVPIIRKGEFTFTLSF